MCVCVWGIYLKCSFAEAKPVWKVKQGVGVVFEGEVGISPHMCGLCWVAGHDLWALQQFTQVNLTNNAPIKTKKKNPNE